MSTATNKKVLIARFEKAPLEGFAQLPEGLNTDAIDLLSPSGALTRVPLAEVRAVCFVREFEAGETWQKQRTFLSRPKAPGLWVRVRFRDEELIEGVMRNDLLGEPGGFALVPPDSQLMHIPREAIKRVEVLGVIGSPLRRIPKKPTSENQLQMFE